MAGFDLAPSLGGEHAQASDVRDPVRSRPGPGTCIVETSDLQGDFERLKSLGVEFVEKKPVVYPNGGGYANFIDPDGNRLSLRGF